MVGTVCYVRSVLRRETRPHVFTWLIWTLSTGTIAVIQFLNEAGPGAWATIVATGNCLAVTLLAVKYGEKNITRSDRVALVMAIAALALWAITDNALIAALLLTAVDGFGYYPLLRKSYDKPREEFVWLYLLSNIKHLLSISAMTSYVFINLVYPGTIFFLNSAFLIMIAIRRHQLRPTSETP